MLDQIPLWFAIFGSLTATDLYLQLEVGAATTSSDEGTDRPGR